MDSIVSLCWAVFEGWNLLIVRPLLEDLAQLDQSLKIDVFLEGTGEHVVFCHAIEEKTLV